MLYRILTENINQKKVKEIVSRQFDGFSIINSVGYWKGSKEKSLIIEISGDKKIKSNIVSCANLIKKENKQDAVLIQSFSDNSFLI